MFLNHTEIRITRTKVKGRLYLSESGMVGKRSQISRFGDARALTLFCSWTCRAPIETVHNRRDEIHKAGQPPGKDYGL